MQNKYPDLMRRRYNDQDFLIRHAYRTDRANTATGFAQGLGFNASGKSSRAEGNFMYGLI